MVMWKLHQNWLLWTYHIIIISDQSFQQILLLVQKVETLNMMIGVIFNFFSNFLTPSYACEIVHTNGYTKLHNVLAGPQIIYEASIHKLLWENLKSK